MGWQSDQGDTQDSSVLDSRPQIQGANDTFSTISFCLDFTLQEEIGYTPDMEPLPLTDPYTFSIVDPIMYKLAKKISLATRMQTQGRFSSTDFQVLIMYW